MAGVARIDNGKSVGNYGEGCYLVPIHAQLGLFLAEPPFVSAFVAAFSRPSL